MQCFQCGNRIENEYKMEFIGCDGDPVCDSVCKKKFEQERNNFYKNVAPSAVATEAWLLSK